VMAIVDTAWLSIIARRTAVSRRLRHGAVRRHDFAQGVTLLGESGRIDTHPLDEFVGTAWPVPESSARAESISSGLGRKLLANAVRVLGAARLPDKPEPVGLGAIADIDMA